MEESGEEEDQGIQHGFNTGYGKSVYSPLSRIKDLIYKGTNQLPPGGALSERKSRKDQLILDSDSLIKSKVYVCNRCHKAYTRLSLAIRLVTSMTADN